MKMRATRQLRDEHEGILVMLRIIETVCRQAESSKRLTIEHFEAILEFLKVFVDKCHHAKEEEILFPALEVLGIPKEGGPIGVMLHEHALGRELIKAIDKSFMEYKGGGKEALEAVNHSANEYVSLLLDHIAKENNVLFVMAESRLSEGQQEELYEGFEKIEEERIGMGKHEEFHKMIHALKTIYLN
jgi:hemerythrin-like domain-containing protein